MEQDHYLFATLDSQELKKLIDSMQRVDAPSGTDVITQGDMGSEFYVLQQGTADIFVDGNKVGEYAAPACFGELALMYSAQRAATIRTTADCVLWSLGIR